MVIFIVKKYISMAKTSEQLLQELVDISKSSSSNRSGGLTGAVSKITELSDNDRDKELNFYNLRLKFNRDYQKVLKEINDKEKLALKMQDEHEKYLLKKAQYDKNQLEYVKKAAELEKLKLNTARLQGAEKKKNEKYILQEVKNLNVEIEKNKAVSLELSKQLAIEKELKDIEHDLAGLNREKNTITKNTSKSSEVIGKTSQTIFDFAKGILFKTMQQDSAMSKLSANYALSKRESGQLKETMGGAAMNAQMLGISVEDLVTTQSNFTSQIGRSVMMTRDNYQAMAELSVATGLGVEGASQMVGEFQNLGIGIADSSKLMGGLMNNAKKQGLDASAVVKNVKENLKLANQYTFAGGLKALSNMAAESVKLKISMSSIGQLSEKLSSVEGSLMLSGSLSTLGGNFAAFADPINLLNQSINDVEGLSKTYSKMLDGLAEVDKKTGEAKVSGTNLLLIRQAAKEMGLSVEEMVQTAKLQATRKVITKDLSLNTNIKSEEDKNLIASLATFEEGKGYTVNIKGKATSIAKLDAKDLVYLQPDTVQIKSVADNTLGMMDILTNMWEGLKTFISGNLTQYMNVATGLMTDIRNFLFGKEGQSSISSAAGKMSGGVLGNNGGIWDTAGMVGKRMVMGGMGKAGTALGKYGLTRGLGKAAANFVPGLGAAISGGLAINDFSQGDYVGGGLNTASALANLIPGIGGFISGGIDLANAGRVGYNAYNSFDHANDLYVPASGTPIALNTRDQAFIAAKDGGAIQSAINSRAGEQSMFETASPTQINNSYSGNSNNVGGRIKLDLSGDITLKSDGGNTVKMDASDLMRNRTFIRELSRLISQQNNADKNGKFTGKLSADSF